MSTLASAFVKAQKAFAPALKSSVNPAFKSKYADLAACVEAVIDALNTNGLALVQKPSQTDGAVSVETVLIHESGETMSFGSFSIPVTKHDAHGTMSALTYCRRGSLMAAMGIAPEDDDGNLATKGAPAKVQQEPDMFAEWWLDMAACADEGEAKLKAAWTASNVTFREYTTKVKSAEWTALKAKAKAVVVPA